MKKKRFFEQYISKINNTYNNINLEILDKISEKILSKIKNKRQIFVCGNGGSASIANHLMCDFNKGIKQTSKKKIIPKIFSLSNSIELITAIGNDYDYSNIFTQQIENYINRDDLIIIFSCSGKSKNITKIIKFAKKKNYEIIKFIGFSKISKISKKEILLSLNTNNYGISEDIFQSIMHMISQNIRSKFIKNFNLQKNKI